MAAEPEAHTADHPLPKSAGAWHRYVWRLTWPVILANITIPLVGVADVFVMGRLPDPAYIAAVAMGSTMFSAVYWMFGFLRMGTTGLVAQAHGAREHDAMAAIFLRALAVAILLGWLIVASQWPLEWALFQIFADAGAHISSLAGTYYGIRIWGAPALLIYLVALGVLFGLQRMRDTLILSIGLNVTNLSLDVVLVLVFDMGVSGVAWGTLISEWGAATFGVWFALRGLRLSGWQVQRPRRLWRRREVMQLFDVSGNLVLRTLFVQLPFFVGTVVAAGIDTGTGMGNVTLAAHGILMQLFFIMTYSLDGFAHTAESVTGYCFGAGRPADLRRATFYSAIWGGLFALLTGLVFITGGQTFINSMTIVEEVQRAAELYLPWVALAPIFCVGAFLLDGIFIGTTHIRAMRNAMILSAAAWAVTLYFSYPTYQYHAVWLAMNVFMLVRTLLLGFYYPRIELAAGARAVSRQATQGQTSTGHSA